MATIHLVYTRLLLTCLERVGIDTGLLYGQDKLAMLARMAPNAHISIEEWSAMVDRAQAHVQDQSIPLMMAEQIKPMDTGPIGFILMACPTVRDAAETLAQFYPLRNDAYALKVGFIGAQLSTTMLPLQDQRFPHLELLTMGAMCWHNRRLCGHDEHCFDARFSFAEPPQPILRHCQRTFGGKLKFNANESVFLRPPGAESLPVCRFDLGAHEALRTELTAQLNALKTDASSSLMRRIEGFIRQRLEYDEVRLEDVAAEMGLTTRTLQTRMDSIGLTFREVLQRTRHTLALAYLMDRDVPLAQVAGRLGFSSQASFNRAFQRWMNMAPGEYRKQRIQAGASGATSTATGS